MSCSVPRWHCLQHARGTVSALPGKRFMGADAGEISPVCRACFRDISLSWPWALVTDGDLGESFSSLLFLSPIEKINKGLWFQRQGCKRLTVNEQETRKVVQTVSHWEDTFYAMKVEKDPGCTETGYVHWKRNAMANFFIFTLIFPSDMWQCNLYHSYLVNPIS